MQRLILATFLGLLNVPSSQAADPPPPSARLLTTWAPEGEAPGEFNIPIGIAINAADEVFITDHHNNRVQMFEIIEK